MKPSLYLETTIPSYLAARPNKNLIIAGKQAITHEFYEFERQKYRLYVSEYVLRECSRGDPNAAKRRLSWLEGITLLQSLQGIEQLAEIYLNLLSIPKKSKIDAFHLAICCVHKIDYLLSWNCTHMGMRSMQIIQRYNDTKGLSTPLMVTPDAIVGKYREVDFDEK